MAPSDLRLTGHRAPERLWKQFMDLCASLGISGNQGINRLLEHSVHTQSIPGITPVAKVAPKKK